MTWTFIIESVLTTLPFPLPHSNIGSNEKLLDNKKERNYLEKICISCINPVDKSQQNLRLRNVTLQRNELMSILNICSENINLNKDRLPRGKQHTLNGTYLALLYFVLHTAVRVLKFQYLNASRSWLKPFSSSSLPFKVSTRQTRSDPAYLYHLPSSLFPRTKVFGGRLRASARTSPSPQIAVLLPLLAWLLLLFQVSGKGSPTQRSLPRVPRLW